MKKKFTLFCLLLSVCFSSMAQDQPKGKLWDILLKDITIKYGFSITYNAYLPRPKFGDELKELDGKELTIEGFFLPVDVTGDVFVLSYNPMQMCFFCDGSGIETIVEINAKEGQIEKFQNLETDNYIKVKGNFKLNKKNYEHLIYILNDVELVEIIK